MLVFFPLPSLIVSEKLKIQFEGKWAFELYKYRITNTKYEKHFCWIDYHTDKILVNIQLGINQYETVM